jgi:hypothetical protein
MPAAAPRDRIPHPPLTFETPLSRKWLSMVDALAAEGTGE